MKIELIDNDFIEIPNDRSVGIGFSGGVDSTLLLWILLTYSTQTVYPMTITVDNRHHRHKRVASEVLELCCKLTGNHNVIHCAIHCEDIDLDDPLHEPALKQNWFIKSGMIKQFFIGTNQLPPVGHLHTDDYKENHTVEFQRRNPGQTKATSSHGGIFQYPFINYDKRQIKYLYDKFGIPDEVYSKTWSCSGSISEDVWHNKKHCGKCGPCQERIYGFGKIE
ncbi:MAG: hypothetical protein CMP47_12320 [Rickettsiales bacterium]|nr:hypothetical protein [Rickettsiales bacterium]